ncbi:MAG TPA: hypothetical protein VN300_02390, partial [Desulfobacterales bacterium]|nr:hypothetical protein [Desulfobacterales bacterium]
MRIKCIRKSSTRCGMALIAALCIAGCAAVTRPPAEALPRPMPAPAGESGWWFVRFRMNWPERSDPA